MRRRIPALLLSLALCAGVPEAAAADRVLVFTRTEGWRHDSIPAAVDTLRRLGDELGLRVDHSEDPGAFAPANLARYRVVVFASTTGDVLDDAQQAAMEGFVRGGGGFVGIHSAADTEYGWPWYGGLVGAYFRRHPPGLQTARVRFETPGVLTDGEAWRVTDELYDFRRNPRGQVRVIATLDTRDHTRGGMGPDHPIAWCHAYGGGHAWYTGLGHDEAVYADPVFRRHLARGLRYAAGAAEGC
ncbi:ThuA domain-containing protein [Vulcaniibacterium tengchongense]|uniref:Type 1 glutamine amidotransferase n=1 Tax=Vulcaniibacterium tengchongense TaxID=1273429 RepID=A0A3N4VTU1_9GAMM|nr:ThuA domain-containing protein [Vulcaniibacterium tengchongense]RPE77240.1 type 1 glutamine amidotransferase [Vulcaniibacterium tengchongense]